jgi:hypothetical protein
MACHGPVLPSTFDPGQILAPTELTPSDRLAVSVHYDSVGMTAQKQGVMVVPVGLLTTLAPEGSCRTFTMIEHAPTPCLYAVVFSKQFLEIGP